MNRPTLALLATLTACTPAGQVDTAKIDAATQAIWNGILCTETIVNNVKIVQTIGDTGKQSNIDRLMAIVKAGGRVLNDDACKAALSADAALAATVKL